MGNSRRQGNLCNSVGPFNEKQSEREQPGPELAPTTQIIAAILKVITTKKQADDLENRPMSNCCGTLGHIPFSFSDPFEFDPSESDFVLSDEHKPDSLFSDWRESSLNLENPSNLEWQSPQMV